MENSKEIRTRIAPSPTGDPHVGTAYIALFNYVFAKKNGGKFLLRIEDTDRNRVKENSEQNIMDSLKWLGLQWDEGPDIGGDCGPYRQSERKDIYTEHAQILMDRGQAYRCFCSSERLTELRLEQRKAKGRLGYDRKCREIDPELAKSRADSGEPCTIRLKMPTQGFSIMNDHLRGEVKRSYEELDDQVLIKSDGFPTYHLANVVDDHLMGITHVIRAEEWIPSTPKHIRLYEAFGWEQPQWIHMPLLRNPDKNKSKISKRKNPVSLTFYEQAGILSSALVNFLALMGFSYGNDIEKFTLQQMIDSFDFSKVSLGGPVFDLEKLNWINGLYMRDLDEDKILDEISNIWLNKEYFKKVIPLVHTRMSNLNDFIDQSSFFFNTDLNYRTKDGELLVPKTRKNNEMAKLFIELAQEIDTLTEYSVESIEMILRKVTEEKEFKAKEVFMPVRIAISGKKASPPLFESMEVLGKERVRYRLRKAAEYVKTLRG
jgi:glutamyl-tRNA synthetase